MGEPDGLTVDGLVTWDIFAVWAPTRTVRCRGFQRMGARHAMRELGYSGVWELFIPGVKQVNDIMRNN